MNIEAITGFSFILACAAIVFGIILYIKVWNACNDIRKIKLNTCNEKDNWRRLYLMGKKDEARQEVIGYLSEQLGRAFDEKVRQLNEEWCAEEMEMAEKRINVFMDSLKYQDDIKRASAILKEIDGSTLPPELSSTQAYVSWRLRHLKL